MRRAWPVPDVPPSFPFLIVPVDKSSLTLTDPHGCKGFGAIGPSNREARGIHALNAVGVSPEGEVLGVMAQRLWSRPPPSPPRKRKRSKRESSRHANRRKRDNRKCRLEEKETQHWIDVVEASARRCEEQAPPDALLVSARS